MTVFSDFREWIIRSRRRRYDAASAVRGCAPVERKDVEDDVQLWRDVQVVRRSILYGQFGLEPIDG